MALLPPFCHLFLLLLLPMAQLWPFSTAESKEQKQPIRLELFDSDQLCVLCHSVLSRWKGQDLQQLKTELMTSCLLLEDQAEAKKCSEGVTDEKLARLNKQRAEAICEGERLCKKGQLAKAQKRQKQEQEKHKIDQFPAIPEVHLAPESGNATVGMGNGTETAEAATNGTFYR